MKDKFLLIFSFFLLMASLPLLLTVHYTRTSPAVGTKDEAEKESAALSYMASLCREEDSDEMLRAVAIILKSNDMAGEALPNAAHTGAAPSFKERVQSVYHSNLEILAYQDKPAAVPVCQSSGGVTAKGDRPYLCAAASPWDAFDSTDSREGCTGVSLNGLRHLCALGLTAEEALRWYVPRLQVTQARGMS